MPKNRDIEKTNSLKKLLQDPEVAKFIELLKTQDILQEIADNLKTNTETKTENNITVTHQVEEVKIVNTPSDIGKAIWGLLKGDKGEKGDKGDTGEKGEKGDKGEFSSDEVVAKIKPLLPDLIEVKDGKDGINPNPEDVVPLVLEKLPKAKELQGEEIVDKINALPTDNEELKIDVSHIKGIPKDKSGNTLFTAIRGPEVKIYDLSSQLDGSTKTFSLPAYGLVFDVRSSSFPYAFRPTVDYTTDGANMTITFTSEINASTTLATGQTIYVLYLTP